MKYDFDEIVNRRGSNSYKWDSVEADVLPMWVADMDFRTAPEIVEALQKRVAHGVFGYVRVPDEYYDAVIGWFSRRHGFTMHRDWILYTSGVVPALSAIVKAMANEGDKVLVQTPVYNCFFSSIRNNGCQIVENELVYADRRYTIDFEDFERKASDPAVKLFLLCNPHNPAGRVWSAEELKRMGDICLRHNVFVVADEIHCEFAFANNKYTPFASISQEFLMHSATCTSPSKAFNIAGLQIANITIADDTVRNAVDRAININEVCDVNAFGIEALMAAYNRGEKWLTELNAYLYNNYKVLKSYFETNMPHLPVTELEGTYLVWVDCTALHKSSSEIVSDLLHSEALYLNGGSMYGAAGNHFVRINIACPLSTLTDALSHMRSAWGK